MMKLKGVGGLLFALAYSVGVCADEIKFSLKMDFLSGQYNADLASDFSSAKLHASDNKEEWSLLKTNDPKSFMLEASRFFIDMNPFSDMHSVTVFSTLGYQLHEDSVTTQENDVLFASLGAMNQVNESISMGAGFHFKENLISSGGDKKSLVLFLTKQLDKQDVLKLNLGKGLSNTTPDWSIGFSYKSVINDL